jgi:hypothetical protein
MASLFLSSEIDGANAPGRGHAPVPQGPPRVLRGAGQDTRGHGLGLLRTHDREERGVAIFVQPIVTEMYLCMSHLLFLAPKLRVQLIARTGRAHGLVRGGLPGGGGVDDHGAASAASFSAAVSTEIYPCNVCSCQEILRRNGRG